MSTEQSQERFRALSALLDAEGARLWLAYLQAEHDGIRKLALARLDAFIAHARQGEPGWLDAWIWAFCEAVRASGEPSRKYQLVLPVRFGLLREVVLPRLFAGYHRREPAALSGLVVLIDFFYYTAPPGFLETYTMPLSKQTLLEEALRVNPDDELALKKLVDDIARHFDYVIHEVPYGVLTSDAQAELAGLDYFEALVRRSGEEEEYRDFIAAVRCYLTAWPAYLSEQARYGSFAAYLGEHDLPLSF
ncbi:hypothetical protein D3C72_613670 [compost metagenome]